MIHELTDGSGFFVAEVGTPPTNPIHWNCGNKVVHDHRDGTIIQPDTDIERSKRGLRVPWKPEYGDEETRWPDIH